MTPTKTRLHQHHNHQHLSEKDFKIIGNGFPG